MIASTLLRHIRDPQQYRLQQNELWSPSRVRRRLVWRRRRYVNHGADTGEVRRDSDVQAATGRVAQTAGRERADQAASVEEVSGATFVRQG